MKEQKLYRGLKFSNKQKTLMQRNGFDIHLSDKELDKKRHKRMKKAEEFKKGAKFVGVTGTGGWGWNELYEKDGKIYVIDTYSKITLLK